MLVSMKCYRDWVSHYSAIAKPLTSLLCKDTPWHWGPKQAAAYSHLKEESCEEGRALKRMDPRRPQILYTDWSCVGMAAVMAQEDSSLPEYVVATKSGSLNSNEGLYAFYTLPRPPWLCHRTSR